MHNGFIDGFAAVKRDLVLAVDESLFPEIKGTADTEVLFCLALTFALEEDPPGAVARAIGLVEACERARGVEYPFQGTIATTDGETLWVFRYSSQGTSRSLFFTRDVRMLRQRYPDREILREVSDDARLVVSEPIADLPAPGSRCPRPATEWSARAATSSRCRSCGGHLPARSGPAAARPGRRCSRRPRLRLSGVRRPRPRPRRTLRHMARHCARNRP
jgi:hypothetical protein